MQDYIETGMVKAEPTLKITDEGNFVIFIPVKYRSEYENVQKYHVEDGYKIEYSDGSVRWQSKKDFETSHMAIDKRITITDKNVDDFIRNIEVHSWENDNNCGTDTIVRVTLANNFSIRSSSSCVNNENYDVEIGKEICLEKIKSQLWAHLGFLLATCRYGFWWKKENDDEK